MKQNCFGGLQLLKHHYSYSGANICFFSLITRDTLPWAAYFSHILSSSLCVYCPQRSYKRVYWTIATR